MKHGPKIKMPIIPCPDEMRAAARILRGVIHSSHPAVQRCVAESLHDSWPSDALDFCSKLEAALLAINVPVLSLNSHQRPRLVGSIDTCTDPRD